jgi:hypothetical protein
VIPEILELETYNCTFQYNSEIFTAQFQINWECYEGEVEIYEILDSRNHSIFFDFDYDVKCQLESYIEENGDMKQWVEDHTDALENPSKALYEEQLGFE